MAEASARFYNDCVEIGRRLHSIAVPADRYYLTGRLIQCLSGKVVFPSELVHSMGVEDDEGTFYARWSAIQRAINSLKRDKPISMAVYTCARLMVHPDVTVIGK